MNVNAIKDFLKYILQCVLSKKKQKQLHLKSLIIKNLVHLNLHITDRVHWTHRPTHTHTY